MKFACDSDIQSNAKRYNFVEKMPPKKKFGSMRRKKIKFTGNIYTQQQDSQQSAATVSDSSPEVRDATEVSNESCVVEPKILVPASLRKHYLPSSSKASHSNGNVLSNAQLGIALIRGAFIHLERCIMVKLLK